MVSKDTVKRDFAPPQHARSRHLVQDLDKEKEEDGGEVIVDVARNREDVLPEREFQLDDPQHS